MVGVPKAYLDFNGSVYWIPFANSMSEASFLRLLMASSISASTSCAFSPADFLESEGGEKTMIRHSQMQQTLSSFL